jgi:hypothetical protein
MVRPPTITSFPQTLSRISSRLKTFPGFEVNKDSNSNSFLGKIISSPFRLILYSSLSITRFPIFTVVIISSYLKRLKSALTLLTKTLGFIGFVI